MAYNVIRKRVMLEGQVQGVGLRFRAEYASQMVRVTGWIKNLEDGKVELELQGSEEDISKLLAELAKGRNVEVEKMTETDIPVVEGEKEFMALV